MLEATPLRASSTRWFLGSLGHYARLAVEPVIPGRPSCPNCGAGAPAPAKACPHCGYRFLADSLPGPHTRGAMRANRRRVRTVVWTAGAVAVVGAVASLVTRDPEGATDAGVDPISTADRTPSSVDVLASHPLSARAAERRLEARFTSLRDGDSASARCSALEPRPTDALRRCRIRYPGGTVRTVILLTNPRGQQLLVEP